MNLDKALNNTLDEYAQKLFHHNYNELSFADQNKVMDFMNDSLHPAWKPIIIGDTAFPYYISNTGLVKNSNTLELRSPSKTPNGYLRIILYAKNKKCTINIHQLVAMMFLSNDNPSAKIYIDHINGDKTCNWVGNLEWVTPQENTLRAIKMGLADPHCRNQVSGSKSGVSKYTEDQAHTACKLLEQGLSNKEISDQLNLPTEFIRSLKRGVWKHVTSQYNIPQPEKRQYYSDDFRNKIRKLIDDGLSDKEIAYMMGLPEPDHYGIRYVNKIRSRYLKR